MADTARPSIRPSITNDRNTRELIGLVRSVLRPTRGVSDGFVVATLDTGAGREGAEVRGNDPGGELQPHVTYRFLGRWTRHATYGEQFAFTTFVRHAPHDREGVVYYLQREAPHVGEVIAGRLWDQYGSDAVAVLRTTPERVAGDGLMKAEHARDAAAALQAISALEDTRIDLWTLFQGRGFPRTLLGAVLARWGVRAPSVIRRDPFALLTSRPPLPGCGFARCDELYLSLRLNPARLKRQMLCAWNDLRNFQGGHTWFKVEQVSQAVVREMARHEDAARGVEARPKAAIRLGLRTGWLAKWRDDRGQLWIAEREKADHEAELARRVLDLVHWSPDPPPAPKPKTTESAGKHVASGIWEF